MRCPLWVKSRFRVATSYVRFGSKADMCGAPDYVRFTPNSDTDCVFRHVSFGSLADINNLFDHLIRTRLQCRRHAKAERPGGLEVYDQLDFSGLLDW